MSDDVASDHLKALMVIRDRLSAALANCDKPAEIAALSGRLVDVLDRIAEIQPRTTKKADDLARKRADRQRAARKSDAADSGSAASSD